MAINPQLTCDDAMWSGMNLSQRKQTQHNCAPDYLAAHLRQLIMCNIGRHVVTCTYAQLPVKQENTCSRRLER